MVSRAGVSWANDPHSQMPCKVSPARRGHVNGTNLVKSRPVARKGSVGVLHEGRLCNPEGWIVWWNSNLAGQLKQKASDLYFIC